MSYGLRLLRCISLAKTSWDTSIVEGWIINSMDSTLIGNFIHLSTTKQVWDSIAITYLDGIDTSIDTSIVKGWLINSMDSTLIGNFIRFSTKK